MEKNLRDTLLTAERVTVEAKDSARREASLIIKEAQIEAEKALRDIKNQAMKVRQEVSQLRSQRESYLGRMKVIAESLLKFIESAETDFDEEDEAFQASLTQKHAPPEALLADPPAENGNLFENSLDATEPPPPMDEPTGHKTEPSHVEPGIPQELRTARVVDPPDTTHTGFSHTANAPDPGKTLADGGPAALKNATVPEPGTKSTLADIDAIIERMAQGQKEMLGATRPAISDPVRVEAGDGPQFEPIPPRESPLAAGGSAGSHQSAGSSPVPVLRDADRYRREPADVAIEYTSEVATAIETPAEEVEPSTPADSRDVPTGTDVTSEMSLDRIRRDLETRSPRAKTDKDR